MEQQHESIQIAKQHLKSKLGLDDKAAEAAVVKGFKEIAKIAGEPLPKDFSVKNLSELLKSGKYQEIEKKARANADRIMAQRDTQTKVVNGGFERVRSKNKFI